MSETKNSHGIPPQAIVPVTETQEPIFQLTQAQRRDAEKFTLTYMQRTRMPLTTHGLKNATELVLGDALPRGMKISGQSRLASGDNIVKIIRAGINERERITDEAKMGLYKYKNRVQTQLNPFTGPYALPRRSVVLALNELQSAKTTPSVSNSEEVLNALNKRKEALPKIADAILSSLSRELFPEASIDMFPDPQDQAKLIRNVLTSLVFRAEPNPVVSIADLADFIKRTPDFNSGDIQPFSEVITAKTGLDFASVNSFMSCLLEQIKYFFDNAKDLKPVSAEGKSEEVFRGSIYRYFDSALLLLHPLLEEKPLVTDPAFYLEGAYSLWNNSFSLPIGGFKTPHLTALIFPR